MFGFQNMSYNSYKNILLHWYYQFPEVFSFGLAMMFSDEANLTYIPLSSFIVLLIILLTCASRKRKQTAFSPIENYGEDDIKGEYAVMCFPCLKKKPDDFQPTTDLTDQFEYIVEKYTIRKVPLLLANTVEDVIERSEELQMAKAENSLSQPAQLERDDFVNFQIDQEIFNEQKLAPCITVAANTICPAKKICKERPRPSDILESMSPITRSPVRNHNYVIIPTKGSLRNKDIMLTKREITTQYLNNFSSIFVDNLKDQVPKDPENFPSLSRPYTSAFKNYPISQTVECNTVETKKAKKGKLHRVAYAFSSPQAVQNEEYANQEEAGYDSETGQEQTSVAENEFQDTNKNTVTECSDVKEANATVPKPTFESTPFRINTKVPPPNSGPAAESSFETTNPKGPKNVTYEDIQALDVGYEFSSCEKLGVKPKMTRIHYPHETEKLVETIRQVALNETAKTSKRNFSQDHSLSTITKPSIPEKSPRFKSKILTPSPRNFNPLITHGGFSSNLTEKSSSKDIVTETSFLTKLETSSSLDDSPDMVTDSPIPDQSSTTTFVSKSVDESNSPNYNDIQELARNEKAMTESFTEITNLDDLTQKYGRYKADVKDTNILAPIKSRNFQEQERAPGRKEFASGKILLPYNSGKPCSRMQESETETSCSLYSHDSKTSTAVTSVRSTELEENKRATLRWTIIIKHHRQNNASKKIKKISS